MVRFACCIHAARYCATQLHTHKKGTKARGYVDDLKAGRGMVGSSDLSGESTPPKGSLDATNGSTISKLQSIIDEANQVASDPRKGLGSWKGWADGLDNPRASTGDPRADDLVSGIRGASYGDMTDMAKAQLPPEVGAGVENARTLEKQAEDYTKSKSTSMISDAKEASQITQGIVSGKIDPTDSSIKLMQEKMNSTPIGAEVYKNWQSNLYDALIDQAAGARDGSGIDAFLNNGGDRLVTTAQGANLRLFSNISNGSFDSIMANRFTVGGDPTATLSDTTGKSMAVTPETAGQVEAVQQTTKPSAEVNKIINNANKPGGFKNVVSDMMNTKDPETIQFLKDQFSKTPEGQQAWEALKTNILKEAIFNTGKAPLVQYTDGKIDISNLEKGIDKIGGGDPRIIGAIFGDDGGRLSTMIQGLQPVIGEKAGVSGYAKRQMTMGIIESLLGMGQGGLLHLGFGIGGALNSLSSDDIVSSALDKGYLSGWSGGRAQLGKFISSVLTKTIPAAAGENIAQSVMGKNKGQ